MKKSIIRSVSLALVLILILSSVVLAAETASAYIAATNAYIIRSGDDVTVYFYIVGKGMMDQIGAKKILLYERVGDGNTWLLVKTFNSTDSQYASALLSTNASAKSSSVTYTEGSATKDYYAIVKFYAEKEGGGDTIPQNTPTSYGTGSTP